MGGSCGWCVRVVRVWEVRAGGAAGRHVRLVRGGGACMWCVWARALLTSSVELSAMLINNCSSAARTVSASSSTRERDDVISCRAFSE